MEAVGFFLAIGLLAGIALAGIFISNFPAFIPSLIFMWIICLLWRGGMEVSGIGFQVRHKVILMIAAASAIAGFIGVYYFTDLRSAVIGGFVGLVTGLILFGAYLWLRGLSLEEDEERY